MLEQIGTIKRANKKSFSDLLYKKTGVLIDPESLYDVQIKRLHEYKRQLLNALRIISLYMDLKENPDLDIQPQTFLFGCKAAAGYDVGQTDHQAYLPYRCRYRPRIRKSPQNLKSCFLKTIASALPKH